MVDEEVKPTQSLVQRDLLVQEEVHSLAAERRVVHLLQDHYHVSSVPVRLCGGVKV